VCLVPAAADSAAADSTQPAAIAPPHAAAPAAAGASRVVLIEFTPYTRHTGPALFNWGHDSDDTALLRGGGGPCAVRVRASPAPGAGAGGVMARERGEPEPEWCAFKFRIRNAALLRADQPSSRCVLPPRPAGGGAAT
jgi:hypothetical protein